MRKSLTVILMAYLLKKKNSDDAKMESKSDHDGLLADDEHRMALQCYFLPEKSSNRK